MIRFIVATLLLAAATAQAQPGRTAPIDPDAPAPAPAVGPVPGELSETTALELSLGGTLASYGAIGLAIATAPNHATGTIGTIGVIGAFAAPTAGHWYAGAIVSRGLGLRAGGFLVFLVGAIADSEGCSLVYGDPEGEPADCGDNFRTKKGTALMITGMAMFVGGTVDDIVTAPARVRRHNERLRAQLALAPVVHRDFGGLALTGTF
jgi:hypothetical protein